MLPPLIVTIVTQSVFPVQQLDFEGDQKVSALIEDGLQAKYAEQVGSAN